MRLTDVIKDTTGKDKDDESISFAGVEKKIDFKEDVKERNRANILYNEAVKELTKIARAVEEKRDFKVDKLVDISKEFVECLLSSDYLLLLALYSEEKDWDIAIHSVNVSIIAFKIGLGLRYERKALNAVVLCAFLHDLGMLTVPKELRNKPGRLSDKEYEVIKRHPLETYRILKGLGDKYKMIAEIAAQEHEKGDGSGYPRGLKDHEIHEYAKIIGLADIYAAMIHPRPQRKRFLPFEAVKQLIAVFKGCFPTRLFKAMINELSAFPVGIYVKLNTKEIGRVVATNRLAPLRPKVEILVDPMGRHLKEPRYLDLSQNHLINIKEAFYKEEV